MSSREISIWIDERWYEALSERLKNETLEEHLEGVLDEMCNALPEKVYQRIATAIWQEMQQLKEAREAARKYTAFHVTERGNGTCFSVEKGADMLQVASMLRKYIRESQEGPQEWFSEKFAGAKTITPEQFDAFVSERLENTGRVTGVFDINLDLDTFEALHILNGWQRFRIRDVSAAAYFAMKKASVNWEERWKVFLDRLDGKQVACEMAPMYLSGTCTLRQDEISFSDEIIQNDNLLEFYLEVNFDPDKVFGLHVNSFDNPNFINVYANFDMDAHCICEELTVILVGSDCDQEFKYRLTSEEKAFMLPKMEEYCKQQLEISLEDCCTRYQEEIRQEPASSSLLPSEKAAEKETKMRRNLQKHELG